MEILAPPPTDPLVRKEPPFDWYRTPPTPLVRTPGEDELDFDPDTALWPANVVSRWPFAGAPTHGIFPKGSVGVDSTATMYVCTVGGEPGTWVAVGSGGGGGITTITSTGHTVTITDPTGPSTNLEVAGGGSTPGAAIVRAFPFAFNTPSILTGAALYMPTVGDILLDAWIEVDTAWDGTTPSGDAGAFVIADGHVGWWGNAIGPLDMSKADQVNNGSNPGNTVLSASTSASGAVSLSEALTASRIVGAATQLPYRGLPGKFTTADPIKVVVSQDGTNTGADPGSAQGAAILYLVTATPT